MKHGAWIAAGLSVGLHAAVLVGLGTSRVLPAQKTAPAPAPLQVEVLRLAGVVPSARAAPPPPARTSPTPHPGPGAKAVSVTTVTDGTLEVAAAPTGTPEVTAGAPAAGPSTEPAAAEAPGPVVPPAPPVESGFDTAELSRRLQEGAAHCYPAAARRFRQTGEAQVRFCLDGAGAVRELTVASSSGSPLLDQAATACVVPGAAPFGAQAFGRCFTLPVQFR